MNFEITFKMPLGENKAFFQGGFYKTPNTKTGLHLHHHTEIHFLDSGNALFLADGKQLELHAGEILVIPPHCLHTCISRTEGTKHKAFQTDYEAELLKKYTISNGIIEELIPAIEEACIKKDYSRVSLYLPLLCSLYHSATVSATPVTDYSFLICEFFFLNYRESVTLTDLARTLCLSERQTERLVQSYTGYSFREMLNDTRMKVAQQLMQSQSMTLEEIAQYVGYQSYSGFWKAWKKYSEKEATQTDCKKQL